VVGPGEPDPGTKVVKLNFDEISGTHVLKTIQYRSLISSKLDKDGVREAMFAPTRLSQGR
jgi:hypothetical protein